VILCIDVDRVVNRDLIDIHQDIGAGDIMIHKDANDEFTEEGCFAIKVNKRTEQFVTNVSNTIQQNATDWDIDGTAIKENIDQLQFTQLDIDKYKNKFILNKKKVKNIISGYESIKKISIKEKSSLNILCRGAAMRYFLTRLYDYTNTPKTALIKIKDPSEYFQKLVAHNNLRSYKEYLN